MYVREPLKQWHGWQWALTHLLYSLVLLDTWYISGHCATVAALHKGVNVGKLGHVVEQHLGNNEAAPPQGRSGQWPVIQPNLTKQWVARGRVQVRSDYYMPRFFRRSSPLVRHAAVLCVSLSGIVIPVGGGVINLDLSHQPRNFRTIADLPGAVNDCFVGATQDACPGLTLGWQPAVPATAVEAAAPLQSEEPMTASLVASPEPEVAVEDWPTMEVRPGDTLFGLAIWFGVSPWDIAAFNGIDIDGLLIIGETLWIPVPAAEFVLPPEPVAFVSSDVGNEPADAGSEPVAALAAVPAPTPAPSLPSFSGTQEDVIAAICSMPWPCDQMIRIAYCESGLNPGSVNPAGYYGLFQINYWFDGWNDPWINARVAYEQKYLPALARGDPLAPWPLCRSA